MDGTPFIYAGGVLLAAAVALVLAGVLGPLGLGALGALTLGVGLAIDATDIGGDDPATGRVSCPDCGARNDASDGSCHHCGTGL